MSFARPPPPSPRAESRDAAREAFTEAALAYCDANAAYCASTEDEGGPLHKALYFAEEKMDAARALLGEARGEGEK